jgi:hypothetical protein
MADIRDTVRAASTLTAARRIVTDECARLNALPTASEEDAMVLVCAAAYERGTHTPKAMFFLLKPWWSKWARPQRGQAISAAIARNGLVL